jgi:hypothetical protein
MMSSRAQCAACAAVAQRVLLLKWTMMSVGLQGEGGRWLAKLIQSQKMTIDATKSIMLIAAKTGGASDRSTKFLAPRSIGNSYLD